MKTITSLILLMLAGTLIGQEAVYDAANHATNIDQSNRITTMNNNLINISKDTHSKMDYQSRKLNNIEGIDKQTMEKIHQIMKTTDKHMDSKGEASKIKVNYDVSKYSPKGIKEKTLKELEGEDAFETQDKVIAEYNTVIENIYKKREEYLQMAEDLAKKAESSTTDVELEKTKTALIYIQTALDGLAAKEAAAKAKIDAQNAIIQKQVFKSINDEFTKSQQEMSDYFDAMQKTSNGARKNNFKNNAAPEKAASAMPIEIIESKDNYDFFRDWRGFRPPPDIDPDKDIIIIDNTEDGK